MKPTILIVEDDAGMRQPLARLLRYEGYETLCAKMEKRPWRRCDSCGRP